MKFHGNPLLQAWLAGEMLTDSSHPSKAARRGPALASARSRDKTTLWTPFSTLFLSPAQGSAWILQDNIFNFFFHSKINVPLPTSPRQRHWLLIYNPSRCQINSPKAKTTDWGHLSAARAVQIHLYRHDSYFIQDSYFTQHAGIHTNNELCFLFFFLGAQNVTYLPSARLMPLKRG